MAEKQDVSHSYEPAKGEITLLHTLFPDRKVIALDKTTRADLMLAVYESLNFLGPGQRDVIKYRYGLGNNFDYTVDEVSRILTLTPPRVKSLENTGLRKLRHQRPSFEKFFQQ